MPIHNIFITGIGTDVGKTIVSAVVCKALGADYWKPVQCGSLDNSDTTIVRRLLGEHPGQIHTEAFAFRNGVSPHAAAAMEDQYINFNDLYLPPTDNLLVIEGAGGLMVPLNDQHTMVDLAHAIGAGVIVVSRNYIGSINHTLLTLFALHSYEIRVLGIIYVGDENPSSEEVIQNLSLVPKIGRVDWAQKITPEFIEEQAERLLPGLRKAMY